MEVSILSYGFDHAQCRTVIFVIIFDIFQHYVAGLLIKPYGGPVVGAYFQGHVLHAAATSRMFGGGEQGAGDAALLMARVYDQGIESRAAAPAPVEYHHVTRDVGTV